MQETVSYARRNIEMSRKHKKKILGTIATSQNVK